MKLESIRLRNFRSFKDAEMRNIPNFCILVGSNGVGKSTSFSVFDFLKCLDVRSLSVPDQRLTIVNGCRHKLLTNRGSES